MLPSLSFRRHLRSLLFAFVALACTLLIIQPVLAAAGIWQSYIVLNGAYYDVNATTGNPDFPNQNLGTFTPGITPLTLSGGEVKTYKNNGTDVQSARLNYRIYLTGSPSGAFTAINLPWAQDLGGGDQRWATTGAGIDLLTGLSDGNYTLEIYYDANTNGVNEASTIYDSNGGSNYKATFTVASAPTPITPSGAKALWLDQSTIAWNGVAGASYKLLYDPDGGMMSSVESTAFVDASSPGFLNLTSSITIISGAYPKNPNANGLTRLLLTGVTSSTVKALLKGQVVIASYNGGGSRLDATRVQMQGVLDHLYVDNGTADNADLGVTYSGGAPTVRLWAPTAKSVTLRKYADSTTTISTTHSMTLDPASGVWSVTGDSSWDRHFYLFDVQVYVPSLDAVVNNLVTDPYALNLSTDTTDVADPRSQFVNLADTDLKPSGWDSLTKPALAAPEDIVIYEMHVRDFSINDSTVVTAAERGTFMAFTYDGAGPDPNTNLSDGMAHLLALKEAGLTHVHLLPAFDIASVPENSVPRSVSPNPTGFGRSASDQQSAVGATRATDGFNWGYDPYHYGAPEGSYSTDPNGVQRILEFRRMVSALNQNGLRVVMDVVYNHTAAKGQEDKSVLDKVVPGYYYRYDTNGVLYETSCCADTASEYAMFEKLMIDTLERWASDYKVDSFRFDLMNLHTRQNMLNVKAALTAIDPTIYLYGEGWDFGSAMEKGLTTCPNCYARQTNMTGQGIGLFNDKIRDAAHGGYSTDSLQIRKQGFLNGLHYDWNAYCYANRFESDLDAATDVLRSSLRASGTDWNGQGSPFTDDPSESVPYVEKHDNETLFDQNVFKLPNGPGDPGVCGSGYVPPVTSMAERVRAQNMGLSLTGLAQGVPFFHMGSDILRSKSLDRNSYDSGDWFNRVDWSYTDSSYANNFGQGLPPSWDNSSRWSIMTPLLNNTALDPAASDAQASAAHLREILRIRKSSPLFRLQTESDINTRVAYFNTGNNPDALLIMGLDDGNITPDLDSNYEYIMVLFNANKVQQSFTIPEAAGMGFTLHPIQADGVDADATVQTAAFNNATGQFTIPARTTAVFVSTQPLIPPSTLDFVGRMWPRGGVANRIDQGAFAPANFDVYVQVYEAGMTEAAGANPNIACYLHWGKYGAAWSDVAMTWNAQIGGNDEYKAQIPQATINALAPGTYGFNAYCKKTSEDGKKWKQDLYDIDSNPNDDDQGDGLITIVPTADSAVEPAGGVFVHLFEWKWTDVEKECTYLAQKGYTAVQVSPPMEHVPPVADMGDPANDYPWWVRYQPVTHDAAKLVSRSGTLAEFQSMVNTCSGLGVDIIVDAVINHTTGVGSGTGTDGSTYTPYDYPQYDPEDFHACGTPGNDIVSYSDRAQVQTCELVNLADLATGRSNVQATLRSYLQALLNMGVAGFRIDAAKHMASQEIAATLQGLTRTGNLPIYIFQEVIDQGGEPVKSFEYAPNGDVTEFRYSVDVGAIFNGCSGNLTNLQTLTNSFLDNRFAVVFTDNHDNQRGHGAGGACVLDHRDGFTLYNLGNIFMLAYPYGHPSVMSSYYWSNNPGSNAGDSKGPPSATSPFVSGSGADTRPVYGPTQAAGEYPANCTDSFEDGKWVCEHRRTAIANMVGFRQATVGQGVTNWQNVSSNHIAFGRGSKGFVAINREASGAITTYTTGMAAGLYCDITKYDFVGGQCVLAGTTTPAPVSSLITVNASGQIVSKNLASMDAFAIHSDAEVDPANVGVAKSVLPTTLLRPGERITYTLVFSNSGVGTAFGVVLTDVVPAQVTGVSVASSGATITQTGASPLRWSVQNLATGQSGTITLTGRIVSPLSTGVRFTNTATIATTSYETAVVNNQAQVGAVASPPLVINEIDYDQPGSGDDDAEFIEIRNSYTASVNLDAYRVVLVNGTGGGADIYQTIDLPNVNLAAGDYYVICGNAANTINCDLDVTPNTALIQNGAPDAVGLIVGGSVVDTVSYEGNTGAPYTESSGAGLADTGANAKQSISRIPDGLDTNRNNIDFNLRCITPGLANLNVSVNCDKSNVTIVKNVTPASAILGQPITYTLAFSNTGVDVATGVRITDIIPSQVVVSGVQSSLLITDTGVLPRYRWLAQNLAAGQRGVITITGVISSNGALVGTTFTNTAIITASNDLVSTNNSDPASLAVAPSACYATHNNGTTVFASMNAHAVQQAVDAASSGGTVKVAGTCVGVESRAGTNQSTYISKTLTLSGGYTNTLASFSGAGDPLANPTVIDANGGGRVLFATNVPLTVSNITLQRGNITGSGGGVNASGALTLSNVQVLSNTASNEGGGVRAAGAVTVVNSRFINNRSTGDPGGGLWAGSTLWLTNTHFISNTASAFGGGVRAVGAVTVANSRFEKNRSTTGSGGGLYAGSTLWLTDTLFLRNSANTDGGGLYLNGSGVASERLVNVLLAGNRANGSGNAIYANHSGGNDTLTILHSTIATPTFSSGAAVVVPNGTAVISNTIIVNHATGIQRIGGTVTQDYNLFFGNTNNTGGTVSGGTNSVVGNPAFVNPAADDYRLTAASAAINIGANAGVTSDFFGDPRPQGGGFDAGYDETAFTTDAAIAKSVTPALVTPGAALTYTLRISNTGTGLVSGIAVSDSLPLSVTVTGVASSTLGSGVVINQTSPAPNLGWTINKLAPGESGIITITAVVSANNALAGQIITNTATITASSDSTSGNNNSSAAPYRLCGPGAYLNTATNQCAAAPPGFYTSAFGYTQALACDPGTYQPDSGQSACLLAPVNTFVPAPGAVAPTPCPASTYNPFQGASSASACLSADLSISKTVTPVSAAPGAAITYTISFSNHGPGLAHSVVISDHAPVSVTVSGVASSTTGGVVITQTSGAPDFAWAVSDLAVGAGGVITLTGTISSALAGGDLITNTATITASNDVTPTNNSSSVSINVYELSGAITMRKVTVGGNGSFGFTSNFTTTRPFTLTTSGNLATMTFANLAPGSGYTVTENTPAGWALTSASCDNGTPGNINVATGATTTCTFTNTMGLCHATPDNGTTVFSSLNAHAVQQAVDAASAGGHVKVAGRCVGVESRASTLQSTYISKTLTLSGGYTLTNWTVSNPLANPTVIDANGGGRVLRIVGVPVEIVALTLQGGQFSGDGGGVSSDGPLSLINVIVQRNTATNGNGGGLNTDSTLSLTNTRFLSNTATVDGGGARAGLSTTVVDSLFQNNRVTSDDGGGLWTDAALSLTNTHFLSNTSFFHGGGAGAIGAVTAVNSRFEQNATTNGQGGGLYANATLTLTNTHFLSNTADENGGGARALLATTVVDTLFQNNHSTDTNASGGGLWTDSALDVTNSHFLSNTARLDGGGARAGGATVVVDSLFQNNRTTRIPGSGGGLAVQDVLSLLNTHFISNTTAGDGGGVRTVGSVTAVNSLFQNNTSGDEGGGLYAPGMVRLTNTHFLSNTAQSSGGGIWAGNAVTAVDSRFENNRSTSQKGGGLYTFSTLTLTDTHFLSNTASGAGGGAIADDAVTAANSRFENNRSTNGSGGGLYTDTSLHLTDAYFISNTASGLGGGAYAGALTVVNSSFENNRSNSQKGGGLYAVLTLWLTNTHFISNTAFSDGGGAAASGAVRVASSRFENNHSAFSRGGGLYGNSTLWLTNTHFISNTAYSAGGGAAASGVSRVANSRFENNRSTNDAGGGLSVNNTLLLTNTHFLSNTASDAGGGVDAYAATVTDSRFENNRASNVGGGIFAFFTLKLSNSHFIGNRGSMGGGAYIYHNGGGSSQVINSLFARNRASLGLGNALHLINPSEPGSVEIFFTTISSPTLTSGSAIMVSDGSVVIKNTIIVNHAVGIHQGGGSVSQDYNLFFGNTNNTSGGVTSGIHSVNGNPAFVNPATDDYHLTAASAAIDMGVDVGVYTDFEGDVRPQGGGFDAGYDETSFSAVGSIVVRKVTVGGDGAFGFSGNVTTTSPFTVTTGGGIGSVTIAGLLQGSSYQVTETAPPGWVLTSASCDNGTPNAITVAAGLTTTCTFTNTKLGALVVQKVTDPNPDLSGKSFTITVGGGLTPASLNLANGGRYTFTNVALGSGYSLTETAPSGWELGSAACSDGSPLSNISVSAGEVITCTFTNVKLGTIVMRKMVVGKPPAADWQLNGPTGAFTLPATGGSRTFVNVSPHAYTLSETPQPTYAATSACSNGATGAASINVTLAAGATITCTFTNTRTVGLVTIIKDSTPKSTQNFNFSAGPPTPLVGVGNEGGVLSAFMLDDAVPSDNDLYPKQRSFLLPNGVYNFSEAPPSNWHLKAIECTGGDGSSFIVNPPNVAITVAGGDVTCTFKNQLSVTIQTLKYQDSNGNGVRNTGEPALANWTITATLQPTGTALPPQVTNSLGRANFNFIPAGTYKVCEVLKPGWMNTQPGGASPCHTLTLTPGQTASVNFGNKAAPISSAEESQELAPLSPYAGVTIVDGDPNAFDGYAVDWAAWVDATLLTPAEEPVDGPVETPVKTPVEEPVAAPEEMDVTPRVYLPVVVR